MTLPIFAASIYDGAIAPCGSSAYASRIMMRWGLPYTNAKDVYIPGQLRLLVVANIGAPIRLLDRFPSLASLFMFRSQLKHIPLVCAMMESSVRTRYQRQILSERGSSQTVSTGNTRVGCSQLCILGDVEQRSCNRVLRRRKRQESGLYL